MSFHDGEENGGHILVTDHSSSGQIKHSPRLPRDGAALDLAFSHHVVSDCSEILLDKSSDEEMLRHALRKTKSSAPESKNNNDSPKATKAQAKFIRRPSDDDFAKMTMLSMRGGGFIAPRSSTANVPSSMDAEEKLPEIPETPFDSQFLSQPSSSLTRTQSERYSRGHRPLTAHKAASKVTSEKIQISDGSDASQVSQVCPKTPTRIPSFRIPSKLRILPNRRKPHHDDDSAANSEASYVRNQDDAAVFEVPSVGSGTPQSDEQGGGISSSWSFSSNEGLEMAKPRSRASTLDRRRFQSFKETTESKAKYGAALAIKPPSIRIHMPPPTAPAQRRMLTKRRSISDMNIPMSLQATLNQQNNHLAGNNQRSIHFDESKKSLGRWFAKMILGAKFGDPPSHRIRRLSKDAVADLVENSSDIIPSISRVLIVGEMGVGKHELVRNFRNIGDTSTGFGDDSMVDIISRGTSVSESSEEIDLANLVAFEYNEQFLILDFLFAETEDDFIQRPPDIIVAIYSVCSPSSLDFCIAIIERLKHHSCVIPLALVGNKSDLVVARTVSKQESRAAAKLYGITLLEVSALLGEKCPELLLGILRQLTSNKNTKSSRNSSTPPRPDTTPSHDTLNVRTSNPSAKGSNTIWARLSKTFSK